MDCIFDLDGTLANLDHRLDFVRVKPPNWKAFEAGIPFDTPIFCTSEIYSALSRVKTNRIILASGRSENCRADTMQWLEEHHFFWNGVPPLYMRPADDTRADDIVKIEMLEKMRADGFNPVMVVDDRMSVCRAWHKAGLFVVCVNQGFVEF